MHIYYYFIIGIATNPIYEHSINKDKNIAISYNFKYFSKINGIMKYEIEKILLVVYRIIKFENDYSDRDSV